jgi:hypothetical protein
MAATHSVDLTQSVAPVLYVSFELSNSQWKMAATFARGQQPRVVSVPAGDLAQVLREIQRAKFRFALPKDVAVFSCYEAGRDGFWLDRFLRQSGINNLEKKRKREKDIQRTRSPTSSQPVRHGLRPAVRRQR